MRSVYLQISAANTYLGSPLGVKFKGCKIRKLTGDTGQGDHGEIEYQVFSSPEHNMLVCL